MRGLEHFSSPRWHTIHRDSAHQRDFLLRSRVLQCLNTGLKFGQVVRAGTLIPTHHAGSSSPLCTLEPTGRPKPVQPALLQEARAKLARQQVQSERPGLAAPNSNHAFAFAACVRRFVTRSWVREGLSGWASGLAWPSAWPTVAGVLAECLSAHRETSRPERSLVHDSRGRIARTHKQPSRFGRNPDGAEGAEGGSLG